MEQPDNHDMIPNQEKGSKKDLKQSVTMDSTEDAEDLFLLAKDRLTDVNKWQEVAGGSGATFMLTDNHGHEVHRHAHIGDHIKIDIPGPGNKEGDGFDWVHIEKIRYDDYPDDNGEAITMLVRPCASPLKQEGETAHFFTDAATSTFDVERHGKIVIAHYHGRNETPNTEDVGMINAARNVIVATGGILGISDLQWSSLVEGLLSIPE